MRNTRLGLMINEMETTTSLILSANQPSMIGGTYPPIMRLQRMVKWRSFDRHFFGLLNDNDYHYHSGQGITFCYILITFGYKHF